MNRLRSERGQAAVLTVVFMAALLGAVALVLDVGSWFREQRDDPVGRRRGRARRRAGAAREHRQRERARVAVPRQERRRRRPTVTLLDRNVANDTVTVKVDPRGRRLLRQALRDRLGQRAREGERALRQSRQARYAAPIAVDTSAPAAQLPARCRASTSATTLDLEKTGPGAFRLINLDRSHGGTGGKIAHGLDRRTATTATCRSTGTAPTRARRSTTQKFKDALSQRVGDELLFPVYDTVRGAAAPNFEYQVIGWVGFLVTGFTATRQQGNRGRLLRPQSSGRASISESGSGSEDFGVRSIELVE